MLIIAHLTVNKMQPAVVPGLSLSPLHTGCSLTIGILCSELWRGDGTVFSCCLMPLICSSKVVRDIFICVSVLYRFEMEAESASS